MLAVSQGLSESLAYGFLLCPPRNTGVDVTLLLIRRLWIREIRWLRSPSWSKAQTRFEHRSDDPPELTPPSVGISAVSFLAGATRTPDWWGPCVHCHVHGAGTPEEEKAEIQPLGQAVFFHWLHYPGEPGDGSREARGWDQGGPSRGLIP